MPRNPYSQALAAAQRRLNKAKLERSLALDQITNLEIEIPSLEHTIAALTHQLDPQAPPPPPLHAAPIVDAALVSRFREVDDSMGSLPVDRTEGGQQLAPDIDSIPGIGGDGFV